MTPASSAVPFWASSKMIPFLICVAILALAAVFIPMKKQTRRAAIALLLVALVFEVAVANFHSFHLVGGDYTAAQLPLTGETVTVSGAAEGSLTSTRGTKMILTYKDIDREVGTLRLKLALPEWMDYVDVRIDATDETQSAAWRGGVADGRILAGDDRSAYIVLNLSGKVNDLRITLTGAEPHKGVSVAKDAPGFTVAGATVNESVPLDLSILRLLLFVLGGMAVYALATASSMKKPFGEDKRIFRRVACGMTAVCVLAATVITFASMYDQTGAISTGFLNTSGNQISQEIVDAFRAGQVHLLDEPSQELLAMENPYDWSARRALGVSAKWDHLLFDGHYYSYYGIAPVLLLFLPYNLITGYYFPTAEAILLFGALGLVFLTLLFLEFSERFAKKIPNSILISTLAILLLSCGVWYNFVYDNFYEIAQASGFMFTAAGFFFLLRSGVVGDGPIRYRHIVLATMCLGWAVLCRPTLALYCIVACLFLVFGYLKHRRTIREAHAGGQTGKQALRSGTVKYILAAVIPFAILGGTQMFYNFARFGNPLDFGIQYSLTINDFTRSQYHTDFVMIGIFNFIFAFPKIMPEFPYVGSNFSTLSANGYYYVANRNAVGILWRALPSLGYLGVVPAWKTLSKRERVEALCLVLPLCVIAPLIIIFSIWESGYGVRYCCDFAWQIILGGAAVLYLLYVRVAEGQGKTILRHAFTVAAVLALIVNGAMIYDYLSKTGLLAENYLRFARVFDFWI